MTYMILLEVINNVCFAKLSNIFLRVNLLFQFSVSHNSADGRRSCLRFRSFEVSPYINFKIFSHANSVQ